jgi:uracil-DNA glycosylase
MSAALGRLKARIRKCRHCVVEPDGPPLPHEPRPVLLAETTARLAVCGQAPGTRVHASGIPFTDPSGDRLRDWMGLSAETFYDTSRIAIIPMGFCFPGLDAKGGDLPPRKECAPRWHDQVFAALPELELVLAVGQYAQRWHLGDRRCGTLTETVRQWRTFVAGDARPRILPLPHPSWRNNAWLKRNPWFDAELVPQLRAEVKAILAS